MDFETLYREHRDMIYQLALRLLEDREAAAEAAQETFAKAFAAREGFRGDSRPKTWLYRIAFNLCVDRLGARKAEPVDEERPDRVETRPEPQALRREAGEFVREALGRLGEDDRRLLCAMMEDDVSYEELATVVGCAPQALRMRVSRARRRLREILAPLMEKKA